MTTSSSLIVIGAGIAGLCVAAAALSRGLAVTVIARETGDATASGVAAGMVAPALEALTEPEPDIAFARLKAAEQEWRTQMPAWGDVLGPMVTDAQSRADSRYVWPQSDNASDITTPRLHAMGVAFRALTDDELAAVASDCDGVRVEGDWLVSAEAVLEALTAQLAAGGGCIVKGRAVSVTATSVRLDDSTVFTADNVVVAAGYESAALAHDVPALGHLTPIKGHLLDLSGEGANGVVRSPLGYLATNGTMAKFGATMQFGKDSKDIEPVVVDDLKARAKQILPDLDLSDARPRAGVRAATPDGWPMIGRDGASGVLVAAGMRRNGYIFAPMAARIVTALILGEGLPEDAMLYRPDRFK